MNCLSALMMACVMIYVTWGGCCFGRRLGGEVVDVLSEIVPVSLHVVGECIDDAFLSSFFYIVVIIGR